MTARDILFGAAFGQEPVNLIVNYLAIGLKNGSQALISSPNGSDWYDNSVVLPVVGNTVRGLRYLNNRWICATDDYFNISIDGINWTSTAYGIGVASGPPEYIGGNYYVPAGLKVLKSADGITWTAITVPDGLPNGVYGCRQVIAYQGGGLILRMATNAINPSTADVYGSYLLYTSNETTFTQIATARGYGMPVGKNSNSTLIYSGWNGGGFDMYRNSTPVNSWLTVITSLAPNPYADLRLIYNAGTDFYAYTRPVTLSGGVTWYAIFVSTDDGLTWQYRSFPYNGNTLGFIPSCGVYGLSRHVLGSASAPGKFAVSLDGVSWTVYNSGINFTTQDIASR
jgi:hypothetical protein